MPTRPEPRKDMRHHDRSRPAHDRRRGWKLPVALLALVVGTASLAACGVGGDAADTAAGPSDRPAGTGAPALEGRITVSAAASLTEAFGEIAKQFEARNPGVEVTSNFDASSALVEQIRQDAPVDVFASADEANMEKLVGDGLVEGTPEVFARNEAVIVTKPGNPDGIKGLADLADVGVVALCGEEVPCGKIAAKLLAEAGVTIPADRITRGQNVKATLGAVVNGDARAGIVYVTDAKAAGDGVASVRIPESPASINVYPIGVLKASGHKAVAAAFVRYVVSARGQAVLGAAGFLPPR